MKIHFKRFIRHKDQIYRQFKELNESEDSMQVGKYICMHKDLKDDQGAYNIITVESDKLRHTKYGDILRKYKIYIDFDKDKKRRKYERMCAFKNIGTYRERLRMDFLLGGI